MKSHNTLSKGECVTSTHENFTVSECDGEHYAEACCKKTTKCINCVILQGGKVL